MCYKYVTPSGLVALFQNKFDALLHALLNSLVSLTSLFSLLSMFGKETQFLIRVICVISGVVLLGPAGLVFFHHELLEFHE
jgi:hypothetical protein